MKEILFCKRLLWQAIKNNKRWYKVRNSEYWFKNARIMTDFWKKTIQVDNPDESIYIKKMYELKVRWDLSDKEIVDEINLMWYKSRKKIKWNQEKTKPIWTIWGISLDVEQLRKYLKSTVYAWIICEEWTWNKHIKTAYEGLVSIDLWNKANRWKCKINFIDNDNIELEYYQWESKLESPIIQKHKNYNSEYPYWKVLKCPDCWWHLTAEKSRSRDWSYHHYYSCRWKKWVKHKNYWLRRDEVNENIVNLFRELKFNKELINLFEKISEIVYKERNIEYLDKNKLIIRNITELENKKKNITQNIQNIIHFPDLLESQNEELQRIKVEIIKLEKQKNNSWERLWLDRFKKCSKKILEHCDKLVLQRENPELIQLIFDIIYGWNVEYEKLKSRTPIIRELLALNTKKRFPKNWKSSLNLEWSDTNKSYQTIKIWIVNLIDKIDRWQYIIDKLEL